MAILKKNNISDSLHSSIFVYCSDQHIQNWNCAAKHETFSRQWPVYTYGAAEHAVMTVNSLLIFSISGLLITNQAVCLHLYLNCQACKSLLYGGVLCLDLYLCHRTFWLCRFSCNYGTIFGKIWHKMYVLIFVQLVSETFVTQEDLEQGVVNVLSLSCKMFVIFVRF